MGLLGPNDSVTFLRPRGNRGRFLRWVIRFAIGLPILAVVCLLGMNLLLMTPMLKGRLERKASAVTGAKMNIGRVTWSPWAGVRAREITMAAAEEAAAVKDVPFFESDTAWVKIRLRSLFKGVLEITEIGMDSPTIACVRSADGRLLLPFSRSLAPVAVDLTAIDPESAEIEVKSETVKEATEEKPESAASDQEVAEIPKKDEPSKRTVSAPAVEAKRSLELRLGDIVIREGKVTLLGEKDAKGLGELRDFQMRLSLRGDKPGTFEASGATVLGRINIEKISGAVIARNGGFEFSDVEATWPGGKVVGGANIAIARPGVPFTVDLRTEGLKPSLFVQADDSVDEAAVELLEHELKVGLRIQGFARALHTVAGAIRFEGLEIPTGDILAESALAESTAERAGTLSFEIAKVIFHLSQGGIVLDDVHFNADRVVIRAVGSISASSELNVAVRTYVPATAVSAIGTFMRGWPKERLMHFTALDYTTYIYRDVLVRGMLSEPAVDLWNDGTFFTIPALLDEIRDLRASAQPLEPPAKLPEEPLELANPTTGSN